MYFLKRNTFGIYVYTTEVYTFVYVSWLKNCTNAANHLSNYVNFKILPFCMTSFRVIKKDDGLMKFKLCQIEIRNYFFYTPPQAPSILIC